MKYETALPIADWLLQRLKPYTDRIEIAGSLRRKKPDVGDIELICIPKIQRSATTNLLGITEASSINLLEQELQRLIQEKRLAVPQETRKTPFGPRYYKLLVNPNSSLEIQADIFCVRPPADWGVIFAIRTGSADFSHSLVTFALTKGMKVKDGQLFKINGANKDGMIKIPCPEEENFFNALGVPLQAPEQRNYWYKPPEKPVAVARQN